MSKLISIWRLDFANMLMILIARGYDVNAQNQNGETPLFIAAKYSNKLNNSCTVLSVCQF